MIRKLKKENSNIRADFLEPNILFVDWRRGNDI
jgi:hypothetical protein